MGNPSLTMLRLFLLQSVLTLLISIPLSAQAYEESQRVNTYLERGQSLDVLAELNLQNALSQGDKLISLTIKAQKTAQRSKLNVVLNGQSIEKLNLSEQLSTHTVSIPSGTNVNSLELRSRSAFVKLVKADLQEYIPPRPQSRPRPMPPRRPLPGDDYGQGSSRPGVVKARLMQNVYSGDTIKVRRTLKQHTGDNLMGKKLLKVVIRGESLDRYRTAQVQLLINGMPVGRPQALYGRAVMELPHWNRNIVGQDIRTVQVRVMGDIFVKVLKVKTVPKRVPGLNQVSINLNRTFWGPERIYLADLLRHQYGVDMNKDVEVVTLNISGQGKVVLKSNGMRLGSVQTGYRNTQGSIRVGNYATINDLVLKVRGTVTINNIRVKLRPQYSNWY